VTVKDRLRNALRAQLDKWIRESEAVLPAHTGTDARHPTGNDIQVVRLADDTQEPVVIGRYSSLNWRAKVLVGGGHHPEWVSTYNIRRELKMDPTTPGVPTSKGQVVIGNDVWIGYEALILSGVKIGNGAVVGARCVVSKDVDDYEIVVGCPQQSKGYRFDPGVRSALLRIAWWDWPESKVRAHADQLNDASIARFVERHDPAGPVSECPDC
jgi:acetyltransferase-like isoleucine patch superfamily enzyme